MMHKPYIGITDFMTAQQVDDTLHWMNVNRVESPIPRALGVGVMMSYKTLNGIKTQWSEAFPKKQDVASIFIKHPKAYNVLHYADMEGIDLLTNLEQARFFGGSNLHAMQLDMVWPDSREVYRFKQSNRDIDLILQIGTKAFELVGNDPEKFLMKLDEYGESLEAVLLDKSMGKGLGMDAQALLPFVRAITDRFGNNIRIVVAGGLGPNSIDLVEPIAREFPLISIDAQGRLRPSGNALDPIDWSMASEYVWKAEKLFSRCVDEYRIQADLGRKQDLSWEKATY